MKRILVTAVATALLALTSAALATPAQADVDANVLGGTVTALADGVVGAGAFGTQLLELPNPLEGIV
ncbi:hypothetical protein FHS39_003375 [Streptomyces olivoverticillatus]|uniref:Secreted protein n=1 Tax=Streptomyces olivoverticillatus TaxID=66427 RepID=A0A7W7LRD5_9ACTN|nr:hypothetical protein [Streptomyces olivoverticillatus]MBB4894341.1 hypothetical protein [Streptomyces olivoverticillatus]